jgi:hypothetical protein
LAQDRLKKSAAENTPAAKDDLKKGNKGLPPMKQEPLIKQVECQKLEEQLDGYQTTEAAYAKKKQGTDGLPRQVRQVRQVREMKQAQSAGRETHG